MCLCPQTIINPKKRLNMQGGEPFVLQVPCGKCAECNVAKQDDYFLRSYYESLSTFENKGFIYFDTLTYRDDALPHISDYIELFKNSVFDYPCFSRQHVRLFLVNLRRKLTALGFDPAHKLRYFLSSEYGTSPNHTHRPHYHIMFYVNFDIDPLKLSELVHESWPHGRTDGIPFQSSSYVMNHVYYGHDLYAVENASRYVSKYVVKDSTFESVITSRVVALVEKVKTDLANNTKFDPTTLYKRSDPSFVDLMLSLIEKSSKDFHKDFRAYISRLCCQFQRHSLYFGLSALKYNNLDEVFETGCLKFKTSKDIVKIVPLSTYFKRKLFYELVTDIDGCKQWRLTDYGKQFKLNQIENNVTNLEKRFVDWYNNMHHYTNNIDNVRTYINNLLDGRTFRDFAQYIALYKGRIAPKNIDDHDNVMELSTWLYHQYYFTYRYSFWLNCIGKSENIFFDGEKYILNRDIRVNGKLVEPPHPTDVIPIYGSRFYVDPVDIHTNKNFHYVWWSQSESEPYQKIDIPTFVKRYVINDTFDPAFRHFDEIYNLYVKHMFNYSFKKQNAYDLKQQLEKKRKDQKNLHIIN